MRGTVVAFAQRTGMAVVDCGDGNYSLIEVLGDGVEPGDVLEGDLEGLGGETLLNRTQGLSIDVSIEDCQMTRASARRALRRFS